MVSSFFSQTTDSFSTGSAVVTDPAEAAKKEEAAKIAKIVAEQQDRAKSLFTKLQEQRKVYAEAKKEYYQAKELNLHNKNLTKLYTTSTIERTRRQERFEESTIDKKDKEKARDAELRRLESCTDSYCSAQRTAMCISIFAG